MAFQIPDGDPAPTEAARHYPQEAKLETWGCNPLELWEPVMRQHWPDNCHWRDVTPVIPIVYGRSKSVVAAVVCHYHSGSEPPDLLRRLHDLSLQYEPYSLPYYIQYLLMELPATLPIILLLGGHKEVGMEYDRKGNLAVSVGVFSAEPGAVHHGTVLKLHLRNPRGGIDDQTTKIVFSPYT